MTDSKAPDIAILIQARLGSERLPKKILATLDQKDEISVLQSVYSRCVSTGFYTYIIMPSGDLSKLSSAVSGQLGWGSILTATFDLPVQEDDVLGRYLIAAKKLNLKHVIRVTADCPLIDPDLILQIWEAYREAKALIAGLAIGNYSIPPRFPDGVDVEVISLELLEVMDRAIATGSSDIDADREHVTSWFWRSLAIGAMWNLWERKGCYVRLHPSEDYSGVKWSIDTQEDLMRVRRLYQLAPHGDWRSYIKLEMKNASKEGEND